MPRAPLYTSQGSRRVNVTGEEYQVQDNGGGVAGAVARGLQAVGRAGQQYAEAEDARQAQYDDTQARAMALKFSREANTLKTQFDALEGENAINAHPQFLKDLEDLRKSYIDQAGNKRMAEFLGARIDPLASNIYNGMVDHSIRSERKLYYDTMESEIGEAVQNAAGSFERPSEQGQYLSDARAVISEMAQAKGWTPEMKQSFTRQTFSGVHRATVDGLLSQTEPDVDMAEAYFEANKDEMTSADRGAVMDALQGPMQLRKDTAELFDLVSGVAAGGDADFSHASSTHEVPVHGTITDNFAAHLARGSAGLDIAANAGSGIKSSGQGTVIESGYGKTGGNFVRVRNDDGYTVSYMHMQQASPYKKGDPVTPSTVIGTVGSTGNATGPHLHVEVKDPQGRQVDPEKYFNGTTPLGSPTDPRRWDMSNVMEQIDAKEASGEYTPERAERMRNLIKKRVGNDEAVLNQQFREADREATRWFIENENFTSIGQMPAGVRDRLSPDAIVRWKGIASDNANGKSVEPNGPVAINLQRMAINEPTRFQQIDLAPYMPYLTSSERESILLSQDKAKQDAGKWTPNSGVKEAYTRQTEMDGAKFGDKDELAIKNTMIDYIERLRDANGGKQPTAQDYDAAYRHATQEVRAKQTFAPSLFGDRFSRTQDIPRFSTTTADQARLNNLARQELRRQGKPVTEENIAIMADAIKADEN